VDVSTGVSLANFQDHRLDKGMVMLACANLGLRELSSGSDGDGTSLDTNLNRKLRTHGMSFCLAAKATSSSRRRRVSRATCKPRMRAEEVSLWRAFATSFFFALWLPLLWLSTGKQARKEGSIALAHRMKHEVANDVMQTAVRRCLRSCPIMLTVLQGPPLENASIPNPLRSPFPRSLFFCRPHGFARRRRARGQGATCARLVRETAPAQPLHLVHETHAPDDDQGPPAKPKATAIAPLRRPTSRPQKLRRMTSCHRASTDASAEISTTSPLVAVALASGASRKSKPYSSNKRGPTPKFWLVVLGEVRGCGQPACHADASHGRRAQLFLNAAYLLTCIRQVSLPERSKLCSSAFLSFDTKSPEAFLASLPRRAGETRIIILRGRRNHARGHCVCGNTPKPALNAWRKTNCS
jgi:hypothetical protein